MGLGLVMDLEESAEELREKNEIEIENILVAGGYQKQIAETGVLAGIEAVE